MPTLCDVNVLLALCYDRHRHHQDALAWIDVQSARSAGLCRVTQISLLRLLCNSTVMGEDACTLPEAWAIYDDIDADERFCFIHEPEAIDPAFRRFTQTATVSPKVWADAYLAAFAFAARLRLVTFDRGFHQFGELQIVLL